MRTFITYHDRDGSAPIVTWRGTEFIREIEVDATGTPAGDSAASLDGNPWFSVRQEAPPAPEPEQTVTQELTDLRAEAASLGIAVDGRWSIATLTAKINEAKANANPG